MPPKRKAIGSSADIKKPAAKVSKSLYARPEKIPEGKIFTDISKNQWRVGKTIGCGGFGDIYTVAKVGEKENKYVMKCEPIENGPLFTEMHFYQRNCQSSDIDAFRKKRGLRTIGMPTISSHGSEDINQKKHRFLILPRYNMSLEKPLADNGGCLPEGTVYRLAIQMLDCYEYIHSRGYSHGDLKAGNILIGHGKDGGSQAYLLDYGLVSRYSTDSEYRPDKKRMHNGTKEYTSRDAHNGVVTMRSDLEILAYNLVVWLGGQLPWIDIIKKNVPKLDEKVQTAKEDFMANLTSNLKPLCASNAVYNYCNYVITLRHNEKPNYEKCRRFFEDGLKSLKVPNSGELTFKMTKSAAKKPVKGVPLATESSTSEAEICASDDDDGDVIQQTRKKRLQQRSPSKLKTMNKVASPASRPVKKPLPPMKPSRRSISCSPPKKPPQSKPSKASFTPSPPKRTETTAIDVEDSDEDYEPPTTSRAAAARLEKAKAGHKTTPVAAKANFKLSPAVSIRKLSAKRERQGSTIVNDNITPNPKSKKTYEFNFELDVSMDANVVVNVKRKKPAVSTPTASQASPTGKSPSNKENSTSNSAHSRSPVSRVRVRKESETADSPRTPVVTVKKRKR